MSRLIARAQDQIATLLGLEPSRRTPLVRSMLHRPRGDAAGYWLQLVIAAALATLGLALNSTAVVIGAMLIAPLMRPIVELAMGLATGSTPLVFRTGGRAILSIVVAVGCGVGVSWLLPFHEITPELLARTAPSMLDLFIAAACAVAGAYAVVIASSDVATTAAGTSIGISLVPPLCTAGYGLSLGDWHMAIGAGLLFTANVTGIVIVASLVFVLVGFGQTNIREEEASLDEDHAVGAATRIGRVVSRRSARLGIVPRILLPVMLLGVVGYPLLKALDAMSHQSTVRQRVESVLEATDDQPIVQYSLEQGTRPLTLRVVMVGEPATARALEQRLHTELLLAGEPTAAVAVWAVSDAKAVSALSARLDDVPAVVTTPAPLPPPPPPPLAARMRAAWPSVAAGTLLSLWIEDAPRERVRVMHLGAPLGLAGLETLAKAVALDGPLPVIDEVTLETVRLDDRGLSSWLARAVALLAHAPELGSVWYCVTTPPPPAKGKRVDPAVELATVVLQEHAAGSTNIVLRAGATWLVEPRLDACPDTPP